MVWFCVVRVTENSTILRSACEIRLALHSNYVPILIYWSKIVDFNQPHLYLVSPLG